MRCRLRILKTTYPVVLWDMLFQYSLSILIGLASVYCQGFSELDSLLELANEDILLNIARRVIIVVVETHFTPTDATRMLHGFKTVKMVRQGRAVRCKMYISAST